MTGPRPGKKRRPGVDRAQAFAVAVWLLAAACSSPSGPPTSAGASGSLLPVSATALPEFDPARFHELLVQLRGKPVVVNVWASWCGPCAVEAAGLARVSLEYEGKVQFLGVDVLDQRNAAQAFIRKYGWTYPSVFDPNGAIRDDLGLLGQPVTVVFDSSGKQVFAWSGPVSESQLREELSGLV